MSKKYALVLALLCAALALGGNRLAESYIDRLPNHDGYYLVGVPDRIPTEQLQPGIRPRHAVLVVIDGLRTDHAQKMRSVQRLREAGQCLLTQVGSVSVSRPVYAVLSTGLEQDRTGARNNDETRPLHVESIWQVARQAGLRVTGRSELLWWKQLFPDGFDSYQLVEREQDHFTTPESELGDLALIHPIYVDENGHDFGGQSPQYAAAAVRADQELGRLLDRLDLSRDVVVFTADHGHTDRGGHGAAGADVARVLTCFSGHGILRQKPAAIETASAQLPIQLPTQLSDNRLIAPALAILLQLRFPKNLRAGEDSLDSLWSLIDPSVYPASYLTDRHAAVQHFREANQAAVGHWLGRKGAANWSDLYQHARRWQVAKGLLLLVACFCLGGVAPRRFRPNRAVYFVLWSLGAGVLCMLIYTAARGSFDFNSINSRVTFIKWISISSLLAGTSAMGVHFLRNRSLSAVAADQVRLSLLLLALNLAHIVAFGWPIGFPVPGPFLFFVPFVSSAFLMWQSILGFLLCLYLASKRVGPSASYPD